MNCTDLLVHLSDYFDEKLSPRLLDEIRTLPPATNTGSRKNSSAQRMKRPSPRCKRKSASPNPATTSGSEKASKKL